MAVTEIAPARPRPSRRAVVIKPTANVPAMNLRSPRERHAPPVCYPRNDAVNNETPHSLIPPQRMAQSGSMSDGLGLGRNR
jgi:hypothetical protein